MAHNQILIESRHAGDDVANLILPHSSGVAETIQRTARYLAGYGNGAYRGNLALRTGCVKAAATLTFTSTGPADTQAFTLCNETFTAVTASPANNQFIRSDTLTTMIANLVAAINASSTAQVNQAVTAVATSSTVITITVDDAGTMGNAVQIAVGTLANTTLSTGGFVGGTNGTETLLDAGGVS